MARNLDSPCRGPPTARACSGGWCSTHAHWSPKMPAPRPIWASWPDASASPPSWPTTCATANWRLRRRRPRGTDPGGDAAAAGPGAGRLRPAGPARPCTPSRGARAAMAYMTIRRPRSCAPPSGRPRPTGGGCGWRGRAGRPLTRSLDHDAGAGAAFRRRGDPPAVRCVTRPLWRGRHRCRVGPGCGGARSGDPRAMSPSLGPLIVGTTFALVRALPEEPLTGELPDPQVRRMMIADHLAFGALERPAPRRRRNAGPRHAIPAHRPRHRQPRARP